jgi:hypothetical protein
VAVDEGHHASETIIDHLLDTIPRELSNGGPILLRLHISSGQVITRQAALLSGFQPPQGTFASSSKLQRLAIGKVVSEENWSSIRQSLASVAALSLPVPTPTFTADNPSLLVNTGTQSVEMTLREMERVLSPVLFLFPERAGVIVPIREQFARDLLGSSPQLSMLAAREAMLRTERVYISAPNTYRRMIPGRLMLFYESLDGDGRGCVIAIARICGSRLVSKMEAIAKVKRRGVLDDRSLEQRSSSSMVTETSFDNIFLFSAPVTLKRLRELGCADGSNFVTVRPISFSNLAQVVAEGHIDG